MGTPSKAQAGRGTLVSISNGAVGSGSENQFTPVGEVNMAPIKAPKWKFEDVTNFDSGKDEEYLSTIRGDGSVTLTLNRVPSDGGQQQLKGAAGDGQLYVFTIVYPLTAAQVKANVKAGDTDTFNAFVLSTGDVDLAPTKKIGLSVDLKVSGPINTTPAA